MNRMKRDEESCESGPPGFSRRSDGMERRKDSARALTRSVFSRFSRTGQGQEETQGLARRWTCMLFGDEPETGKKMKQDGGQRIFPISESRESCHPVKGFDRGSSKKRRMGNR